MKAILKPLKPNPWSGIHRYANCAHYLGPYLKRSGQRYTGLDEFNRERFEKILGVDLRPSSEFWDNYSIRIDENYVVIDTDDGPEEELKYLFLKSHKRVAASLRDRKATADYVLIQPEEDAKAENEINRIKRKASSEFDRMGINEMRKALRIFGYNPDSTGDSVVESNLYKIVESDPKKFLTVWVDNKDREILFLLEDAVASNIIRKTKTTYKYGTDVIGGTADDAIAYLKNPANQDLKIAITSQLEAKKAVYIKSVGQEILDNKEDKKEVESDNKKKSSK